MLIAGVAIMPLGILDAAPALVDAVAVAAGIGVGVSSSVIPYVFDQMAMERLARATSSSHFSPPPRSSSRWPRSPNPLKSSPSDSLSPACSPTENPAIKRVPAAQAADPNPEQELSDDRHRAALG